MDRKNKIYLNGISVLICTYNGAKNLPQTLEHLAKQDFQYPFEVIVVNNASTDETNQVALNYKSNFSHHANLSLLQEPQIGKIHALKLGLSKVKYKYVLICDDDNWLNPNYLSLAFDIMESNPKIGILGGKGEAVCEINPPKWFDGVSHKYAVGSQGNDGKLPLGGSVYGAGSVINRAAYDALIQRKHQAILIGRQGNKLTSGTDTELCLAVQLLAYEIHIHNSLEFKHYMTADRLTKAYFKRLSKSMVHSSFLLYAYGFVLRNIRFNWLNYWLAVFYLLLRHTYFFIKKSISSRSPEEHLVNWYRYQIFWQFFKYPRTFKAHWKKIAAFRE